MWYSHGMASVRQECLPVGCEATKKLFEAKVPPLVGQVLLPQPLLSVKGSVAERSRQTHAGLAPRVGVGDQVCEFPAGSLEEWPRHGGEQLRVPGDGGEGAEGHDAVRCVCAWGGGECVGAWGGGGVWVWVWWLCSARLTAGWCRDLTHGEDVTTVLDKCPWWATYKGLLAQRLAWRMRVRVSASVLRLVSVLAPQISGTISSSAARQQWGTSRAPPRRWPATSWLGLC